MANVLNFLPVFSSNPIVQVFEPQGSDKENQVRSIVKDHLKKEKKKNNKTPAVRSRVYREYLDCEKGIPLLVSCIVHVNIILCSKLCSG